MAIVDYDKAFPDDTIKQLRIVVNQSNWDSMMSDMAQKFGAFGGDGTVLDTLDTLSMDVDTISSDSSSSGQNILLEDENPIWVPAELQADDYSWSNIGLRFKGNSTLAFPWAAGSKKLPFRINMDKYEDDFPATKNQRYWGFNRLALSNNYGDASIIRDKIAGELLDDAGVPVTRMALVRVTLVHGDSVEDLGIYTLAEIPDKPMLDKYFSSHSGSLFKPISTLSEFVSAEFPSNDDAPSTESIEHLIRILQDSVLIQNPSAWRDSLESTFNVKSFINVLAANKVIDNWDAYGAMAHNYYLYDKAGVVQWIPYDLGSSLGSGLGIIDSTFFSNSPNAYYEDVTGEWPLIYNVMNDSLYRSLYVSEIKRLMQGPLSESAYQTKVDRYADLVTPYITDTEFSSQVSSLRTFMAYQISKITSALANDSKSE